MNLPVGLPNYIGNPTGVSLKVSVVLISAKQGGGKSTLSAMLRVKLKSLPKTQAHELIFAGPIYEMHDYCRAYLRDHHIQPQGAKDGELLQYLGTEWGRQKYGDDVWVNILRAKIRRLINEYVQRDVEQLVIVVPDTRFKNELEVWEDAIKVRLECPEVIRKQRVSYWRDNSNHPSEVDLDGQHEKFDMIIDTNRVDAEEGAKLVLAEIFSPSRQRKGLVI